MDIIGINKFQFVKNYLLKNNFKTILDVGCRDCELKNYVILDVDDYKGCDLFQNKKNSVDYVADLEKGLPLADESFDCVVALDLVEHLNGFQEGIEELLRVTKKDLIIMLPNISHLFFRLKFLFTGSISDKYSLNNQSCFKGSDRHRWLIGSLETDKYMNEFSQAKNLKMEKYNFISNSGKMMFFYRLATLFNLPKSLYVWSVVYVFRK